ncbi:MULTISPECIES: META domain-containing protein [unclassified Streptomyces]|uniref:META domain-containing protein n=1 Tax=unclassified Streptomyces TaxID=2593676 RepID=UPI0037F7DF1B
MDKQRLTLTVLSVLPLLVSCGSERANSSAAAAGPAVKGVHWSVDSVTADGRTSEAPGGAWLRIDDNGETSGALGCNDFGATASVTGDQVSFGRLESTALACDNAPQDVEKRLAGTLGAGPLTARVDGDRLTLTTENGDHVRLTEEPDAPFYGTEWTFTALRHEGVTTDLSKKTAAHLTFDKKSGNVTGSLGCNHLRAKATVRDGHITLGSPLVTKMMCDTSLMNTEKALLSLFDGPVGYKLDHRNLALTSKNGESADAVAKSVID